MVRFFKFWNSGEITMKFTHNGEELDSDSLMFSQEQKVYVDIPEADNMTLRFKLQQSLRKIERFTIKE